MTSEVWVDGVQYSPGAASSPRIGIAITTHNRNEVLQRSLSEHLRFLPNNSYIVVIDDGSNTPVHVPDGVDLHRFFETRGIVASKNKSLELLMDRGCEYLALWDDDAFPTSPNWFEPYVQSRENHLSYQFLDLSGSRKLNDIKVIFEDGIHTAYTGQRGVMLWYSRLAIETAGGFDSIYGRGLYEHPDLANRIHEHGLTTFRYMDVADSDKLIHSMDEHEEVKRSIPTSERESLVKVNAEIFNSRREAGYSEYVPYRDRRNVVLTSLLTGGLDPQRSTRMDSDWSSVKDLHSSLKSGDLTVFHDQPITGAPKGVDLVPTSATGNPYFLRWVLALNWLKQNRDVDRVVICDATDVKFLQDPFDLQSDGLIVGEEFQITGCAWMRENHKHPKLEKFFDEHHDDRLLNAGVVIGDRELVIEFLSALVSTWQDFETDRFHNKAGHQLGDMGIFNYVARTKFDDRITSGPRYTTLFKHEQSNEFSFIKHK